jgi:hypothetical protein
MTVAAELNFDDQTPGANVTLTAPWSSVGTLPTTVAAAADHGALGARWASTGTSGRLQYDTGSNQTVLVSSCYFNVRTFSTANQYISSVYSLTSGGAIVADLRVNTSHTVTIRDSGTSVATSTATINSGFWYRTEWKLDSGANTQTLRFYEGESSTPLFTLTGAYTSDLTRVPAFGPNIAAAGGSVDYDTIKIADDWVGPEAPGVTLTPVLRRLYFHNGQWI